MRVKKKKKGSLGFGFLFLLRAPCSHCHASLRLQVGVYVRNTNPHSRIKPSIIGLGFASALSRNSNPTLI